MKDPSPDWPTTPVNEPPPPVADDPAAPVAIDLDRLNAALGLDITAAPPPPRPDAALEELADDLLQLLRRIQAVEQRQEDILARLDQLSGDVRHGLDALG